MAISINHYKQQYENYSLDDLRHQLKLTEAKLNSVELQNARQAEIDAGVDDNNCIGNVETEIYALKELIKAKE